MTDIVNVEFYSMLQKEKSEQGSGGGECLGTVVWSRTGGSIEEWSKGRPY